MKTVLVGLLALVSALPVLASREFSVAPTHVFVDLHKRTIQKFIVSNTGDQRIHIGVRPLFMAANSRSLTLGNVLQGQRERDYDLSPYVVISPHALSLAPGQQRELRMSITAPPKLADGAYRAHLLFYQIRTPQLDQAQRKSSAGDSEQMKMQLNMRLELAISVYGTKGRGAAHLAFICKKNAQNNLQLHVINDSPWRFEGTLQVRNLSDNTSQPVDLVMLRDTERTLDTKVALHAKQYQLQWQADKPYIGEGTQLCKVG